MNKKEVGVAFKKDAKAVGEALEALPECDALALKVGALTVVLGCLADLFFLCV